MTALLGVLPYLAAAWVLAWGLYGIVSSRNLVHLILCLGVVQTSTYLLLLGIGWRLGATAPVYSDISPKTATVDSIVQALMLTDVVVEATVMALLLAMTVQAHDKLKTLDPDELRELRG